MRHLKDFLHEEQRRKIENLWDCLGQFSVKEKMLFFLALKRAIVS